MSSDSAVNQKENLFKFCEQLNGLMQPVEWPSEYFLQYLQLTIFVISNM